MRGDKVIATPRSAQFGTSPITFRPQDIADAFEVRERIDPTTGQTRRELVLRKEPIEIKPPPPPRFPEQQFGLPPGDPEKTVRGRYAQFMSQPVVQGASAFLSGGIAGAAVGTAIVPGVGTLIGGVAGTALGWLAQQQAFDQNSFVGQAFHLLDIPRQLLERGAGTAIQIGHAIGEPQKYGTLSEVLSNLPAAWEAARSTYEAAPIFPIGGTPMFQDQDRTFVDWDLPEANGGIGALVEARHRIAAGDESSDQVWAEMSSRFGAPGQMRELFSGFFIDPLNAAPHLSNIGIKAFAKLTKNADLLRAAQTSGRGLVGTLQQYRNMLAATRPFREGFEAARDLTRFQRMLIGNRMLRLAETGTFEDAPWWQFWKTEPLTEATERVVQASSFLQSHVVSRLAWDERFPDLSLEALDGLKTADLSRMPHVKGADELARAATTIEGRINQRALDVESIRDLNQWWHATTAERTALVDDLARTLQLKPEEVLERIVKGNIDDLARQYAERAGREFAIAPAARPAQPRLPGIEAEPAATRAAAVKAMTDIGELFKKKDIPYTPNHYVGAFMNRQIEAMGKWASTTFGIKAPGFLTRISNAAKAVQTTAILGYLPSYLVNNTLNGEAMMVIRGTIALKSIASIMDEMRRANLSPVRMVEGMTMAGIEDVASGAAWGATSAQAGMKHIREAANYTGILKSIQQAGNKLSSHLLTGPMTVMAQKVERWQSARSWYAGWRQMRSQLHRRGRGIPWMDRVLEDALRQTDARLPDLIYSAAEAGLNPQEIAAKVFDAAPKPVVEHYISRIAQRAGIPADDVSRLLAVDGMATSINDALAKLPARPTPEQIRKVIGTVREEAEQNFNRMRAAEYETNMVHAIETAKVGDLGETMNLLDDVEERLYETYLNHMQALDDGWTRAMQEPPGPLRDQIIKTMLREEDTKWGRYFDYEDATLQGVTAGMDKGGLRLDDNFLTAARGRRDRIGAFHAEKRRLLDEFFEKWRGDDVAWRQVREQIDGLYGRLIDDLDGINARTDDYMRAVFARHFGDDTGRLFGEWRDAARRFNREDMQRVQAFRRQLRDVVDPQELNRLWRAFHQERLVRRREILETSINLRRRTFDVMPLMDDAQAAARAAQSGVPVALEQVRSRQPFSPRRAEAAAALPAITDLPGSVEMHKRMFGEYWRTPPDETVAALPPTPPPEPGAAAPTLSAVEGQPGLPGVPPAPTPPPTAAPVTGPIPPRTLAFVDMGELRRAGWQRGQRGLFNAVNADRRRAGLAPYKSIADVPLDEAFQSMNTRLEAARQAAAAQPRLPEAAEARLRNSDDLARVVRADADLERAGAAMQPPTAPVQPAVPPRLVMTRATLRDTFQQFATPEQADATMAEIAAHARVMERYTGDPAEGYIGRTFAPELEGTADELLQSALQIGDDYMRAAMSPEVRQYPGPIKIDKAENLSLEQRAVEARFAQDVAENADQLVNEYWRMMGEQGNPNVLDVDNIRELSPDYSAGREARTSLAAAVHEPASALADEIFRRRLAEPGDGRGILFTAGGGGAGKSSAIRAIPDLDQAFTDAHMVFDGTLAGYASARRRIQQALDAGHEVDIVHVYREPVDAMIRGVVPRTDIEGRAVPLDAFARAHAESPRTILRLAEEFQGNPRVRIRVVDNSRGPGNGVEVPIDFLRQFDYTETALRDAVTRALDQEWHSGNPQLTAREYRAITGNDPPGRAAGIEPTAARRAVGVEAPAVRPGVVRPVRGRDVGVPQPERPGLTPLPVLTTATGKGAVTFLRDGRAVIRALRSPDVSTLVHEVGHVFRSDLEKAAAVSPRAAADLRIASEWAGARPHPDIPNAYIWDRRAEEKFARGWERYHYDGIAPTPELRNVFEAFKEWLAQVYKRLRGSAIDLNIPPEMRGVYDRLLAEADPATPLARYPHTMRPDDFVPVGAYRAGQFPDLQPGAWRIDDIAGGYGREIAQLREVNLADLTPTEHLTEKPIRRDAILEVSESDDGRMIALGPVPAGEGTVLAWVRPAMDTGGYAYGSSRPVRAAMTYEAAVLDAAARGDPVDPAVLQSVLAEVRAGRYPELANKHPALPGVDPSAALRAGAAPTPPPAFNPGDVVELPIGGRPTRTARGTVEGTPSRDAAGNEVYTVRLADGNTVMGYPGQRGMRLVQERPPLRGEVGSATVARGPDPTQTFDMRFRVAELDDLIASHDSRGNINPAFPPELQPRARDRAAYMLQAKQIAQELVPDALLDDLRALDRGSPIIGPDGVVESGNGRTIALRMAAESTPERYAAYQARLIERADEFGVDPAAIAGMERPVLVRERLSDVDRLEFTRAANAAPSNGMSMAEKAISDARFISDDLVNNLFVGETMTIDQALRSPGNADFVRSFLRAVPENEAAGLVDAAGALSQDGARRITAALFARALPGPAGQRLVRAVFESTDLHVRNVANGIIASVGDLARIESRISSQQVYGELSIGADLAAAVDKMAAIKAEGGRVDTYLAQMALFDDELTPFQRTLLADLDSMSRSQKRIRETLRTYADMVDEQPDPRQGALFAMDIPDRATLWERAKSAAVEGPQATLFQDAIDDVVGTSAGDRVIRAVDDESVTVEQPDGTHKRIPIRPEGDPPLPPGVTADMGGRPTPIVDGLEDMYYRNMRPILDGLEAGLIDDAATPPVRGAPSLDADTRLALTRWVQDVQNKMGESNLLAMKWGEFTRDAALLNYRRRYKFNTYLGWVFPYEFFMTHSILKWALHSIDHPSVLANYYRVNKFINTEVTDPEMPSRLRGRVKIPLPFLPEWMGGGVWIDPLKIGLPIQSWIYPWEEWEQYESKLERAAGTVLSDMLNNGEIDEATYQQAIQSKAGDLWDRAVATAQEQDKTLVRGPFDLISGMAAPHAPLMWAYQALRGTPERIGPLPITRTIRAASIALGIGGPSGVNIEEALRRQFGLPIFDQWTDYRIDRELANMAAEGLITSDQAKETMIGRQGPIFEMAQRREAQQFALAGISGLPLGFYPEGEKTLRELKPLFDAAWRAENDGDTEALQRFFEDNPEYEARLALYQKPEERIRNFLIDKIWERYLEMPGMYRNQAAWALGAEFETMFLDKETRSYDGIDLGKLQQWAVTLGQMIPGKPDVEPIPVEWAPPRVAADVELYYQQRESSFDWPALREVQSEYFTIPKEGRVAVAPPRAVRDFWGNATQQFPDIAAKLNTLRNLSGRSRTEFRKANPDIKAYFAQLDEFKRANPDDKKWFRYGILRSRSRSARSAFVAQHPELAAYWDWRRSFLETRPQVKAYLDEYAQRIQAREEAEQGGVVNFGPEMNRSITVYLFAGRQLTPAARRQLEATWESYGRPGGSLEGWLLGTLASQQSAGELATPQAEEVLVGP